jgi:protein XagA
LRIRRTRFLIGIALASILAAQRDASAGAWLQPQGEGLAIATTDFSDSTRYFDSHGKLIPIPEYQKFSLGTYIEYGLSNDLTLVAQPFFDSDRQATSPTPTRLTTGGTDIGLRAGVGNFGGTIVSLQATAHVPFVTRSPLVDFDEDTVPSGDFRLLLGHAFTLDGFDCFADLEGSYRIEGDDEPGEWHIDATLGARPRRDLLLLIQSFATFAAQATPVSPTYIWVKLQESAVYEISPRWSLQGGFFETLAGSNSGRELGPTAALWYHF